MPDRQKTIPQKVARDSLGSPGCFQGGVYVTRNGVAELFIQPVGEREAELAQRELDRQSEALLKMVMMAKADVEAGRTLSTDEALQKMRDTRQGKGR